jgi:hypothetical protein
MDHRAQIGADACVSTLRDALREAPPPGPRNGRNQQQPPAATPDDPGVAVR